mgnify:CR=1 FL=1
MPRSGFLQLSSSSERSEEHVSEAVAESLTSEGVYSVAIINACARGKLSGWNQEAELRSDPFRRKRSLPLRMRSEGVGSEAGGGSCKVPSEGRKAEPVGYLSA